VVSHYLYQKNKYIKCLIAIIVIAVAIHGALSIYDYYSPFPPIKIGKKVPISGVVASIADIDRGITRFLFQTDHGLIKLSVYPNKTLRPWQLTPGSTWKLWVKLKTPEGFKNPHVFDYGQWLKSQGIKATGYVVNNKPIQFKGINHTYLVERLPYNIERLLHRNIKDKPIRVLANALLIGNKNELTPADKKIFRQTGTSHLIAISGLHIGLIAFFAFILIRILWSLSPRACQMIPAQKVGIIAAMTSAFIYSLMAGLSIPTQRAFIMVFVFAVALLSYRKINHFRVLFIAGVIVTLWHPFSIFEAGFWLSFMAVFFLIFIAERIVHISGLKKYILIQLLLMLLLIPLSIYWFNAFSAIGMVANLLAIPWVSFVVVPGLFINFMLSVVNLSQWWFSSWTLEILLKWLTFLSDYDFYIDWHYISLWVSIIAIAGIMLLLLPVKWPIRLLAFCLLFPVFQSPIWPENLQARITILEVGHGLAVVIQMPNYTLIYDTGGASGKKFAAANLTLIPFLKAMGINTIDKLIISHRDKDHSGGLPSLLAHFKVNEILSGEKIERFTTQPCEKSLSWQVDKIHFDFLNSRHFTGNNSSCVLKISNGLNSLLLTGDIQKKAERYLLKNQRKQLPSTVLVAPHHGSQSSSSEAFVYAVNPEYVIFSSGNHQGFKLPRDPIKRLYHNMGSKIFSTAENGAITVEFYNNDQIQVFSYTNSAK